MNFTGRGGFQQRDFGPPDTVLGMSIPKRSVCQFTQEARVPAPELQKR